jgi:hypothetical protein
MSVYLTGIHNPDVQKQTKTVVAAQNTQKLKKTRQKNNISSFVSKNQDTFEKTTSMMLDYLVNEETNYTDMIKIEDYLKNKNLGHYKKYNSQGDEIIKKRELVKNLEMQITEVKFFC